MKSAVYIVSGNSSSLQITGKNCLSIYFGEWPWHELQLASSSPETVQLWCTGLQTITEQVKAGQAAVSSIDYWLRCMYVELKRENNNIVHAVIALGGFAGLRLWRAYKVSGQSVVQVLVVELISEVSGNTQCHMTEGLFTWSDK